MKYRTLINNAKHLGHKVFGVATGHYSRELVSRAFQDLGVQYFRGPESGLQSWLDRVRPDAFFGEQFWTCKYEAEIKKWADRNGAKRFEAYHGGYYKHSVPYYSRLDPRDTILMVNAAVAAEAGKQTKARRIVVGVPELDALATPYDTREIRERLGVSGSRPLVAVFLHSISRMDTSEVTSRQLGPEPVLMSKLMDAANRHGWKVVAHPHPNFRGERINRIRFPAQRAYFLAMQDRGAQFVTPDHPGVVDGLRLKKCRQDELLAAADAVSGSSISESPPAYAAGKKYFYCYDKIQFGARPDGHAAWDIFVNMPNTRFIGKDFSNLVEAVEHGDTMCERDDEVVRRVFFKLDGKCWKRLLYCATGQPLGPQESFLVM